MPGQRKTGPDCLKTVPSAISQRSHPGKQECFFTYACHTNIKSKGNLDGGPVSLLEFAQTPQQAEEWLFSTLQHKLESDISFGWSVWTHNTEGLGGGGSSNKLESGGSEGLMLVRACLRCAHMRPSGGTSLNDNSGLHAVVSCIC